MNGVDESEIELGRAWLERFALSCAAVAGLPVETMRTDVFELILEEEAAEIVLRHVTLKRRALASAIVEDLLALLAERTVRS